MLRIVLFSLVPDNDEAREIVAWNPDYKVQAPEVGDCLPFTTDHQGKTPGRLASFGRSGSNDVLLPTQGRYRGRGGPEDRYQNYRNQHCYFFLAPSGELILRDLAPGLTAIELENTSENDGQLYGLHGQDPRQRVIPRTDKLVYICIGIRAVFKLIWNPQVIQPSPQTQQALANHAHFLAPTGNTHTGPSGPHLTGVPRGGTVSRFAPSIPTIPGTRKSIHRYEILGSGSFGEVHKVVDLNTGQLWALKEIRQGDGSDRRKVSFKDELELLHGLQHKHIVNLESFQSFHSGGSFQLFFSLYDGGVDKLLPTHNCRGGHFPARPEWLPRFVNQVLTALQYLHDNRVVHRDIKPDNILFNQEKSGEINFYVADFGLSKIKDNLATDGRVPVAGTPAYMAWDTGSILDTAADVWAFAITLGRICGFWCEREMVARASVWDSKAVALGGCAPLLEGGQDADIFNDNTGLARRRLWSLRVKRLAQAGLLPPMFSRMLEVAERRATVMECLGVDYDDLTLRPGQMSIDGA